MILDVIVEDKKKRLVEHKQKISEDEMKKLALASFTMHLQKKVYLLLVSLKRLLLVMVK